MLITLDWKKLFWAIDAIFLSENLDLSTSICVKHYVEKIDSIVLDLVNKNLNRIYEVRIKTNYMKDKWEKKIWNKIGKMIYARPSVTKKETNYIREDWKIILKTQSKFKFMNKRNL